MALTPEYRDYLGELFACIGPISLKRMFGLDALMAGGVMVGLVIAERIHLRTDDASRPSYEAEGGKPFTFMKGSELIVTSYVSIPDRLYDEPEELALWARHAYAAAQQSPTAVKKRAKRARVRRHRVSLASEGGEGEP